MISAKDSSVFDDWASEPCGRKLNGDNIVYRSRVFQRKRDLSGFGFPILSNLSEARIGEVQEGLIQPELYRAPEVILGMKWTSKVDIWNVGVLIWDLFEDHHLFDTRRADGSYSEAHHLAEMMRILGPPPINFLRRSEESGKYWDATGKWKGMANISDYSLDESEKHLKGDNKKFFMQFVRKLLRWDPEERLTARELLMDPWLSSSTLN